MKKVVLLIIFITSLLVWFSIKSEPKSTTDQYEIISINESHLDAMGGVEVVGIEANYKGAKFNAYSIYAQLKDIYNQYQEINSITKDDSYLFKVDMKVNNTIVAALSDANNVIYPHVFFYEPYWELNTDTGRSFLQDSCDARLYEIGETVISIQTDINLQEMFCSVDLNGKELKKCIDKRFAAYCERKNITREFLELILTFKE